MAMIKCEDCGKEYSDKASKCPNCGCPNPNLSDEDRDVVYTTKKGKWSSGRLVIGIISIILFLLIAFQSCAAGVGNALADKGETTGSLGLFLAFMMLIAGIIAICTKNVRSRIGTMVPAIFYWLGALVGVGNVGTYKDLAIWAGISFIFGLVFVVAGILTKKR
jgi:Ni,Fe-hydrogenase I cytochrome b subunit